MHPAFWPYLIGWVPIFLARTSRARVVAIFFGLVSLGLAGYHIWSIQKIPDVAGSVQQVGYAVIVGLSIAAISTVVTYFVDKRHDRK